MNKRAYSLQNSYKAQRMLIAKTLKELKETSDTASRISHCENAINAINTLTSQQVEDIQILAIIFHQLGTIYFQQGDYDLSETNYVEGIKVLDRLATPQDDDYRIRIPLLLDLATAYTTMDNTILGAHMMEGAVEAFIKIQKKNSTEKKPEDVKRVGEDFLDKYQNSILSTVASQDAMEVENSTLSPGLQRFGGSFFSFSEPSDKDYREMYERYMQLAKISLENKYDYLCYSNLKNAEAALNQIRQKNKEDVSKIEYVKLMLAKASKFTPSMWSHTANQSQNQTIPRSKSPILN